MVRAHLMYGNKEYRQLKNVELLSIAHDDRFTGLTHILVALNNEQAIEAYENNYNVKVATKETRFLGNVLNEDVLYLQVRVPRILGNRVRALRYEGTKIIYPEGTMVNLDISALEWRREDKTGYVLYFEGVEFVDRQWGNLDVYLDSLMEKLQINEIPTGLTPAEIYRAAEDQLRYYRENVKQSFSNTAIQGRRTIWVIGDVVAVDGEEYVVGSVRDLDEGGWNIRLDKKYHAPRFLRVPK